MDIVLRWLYGASMFSEPENMRLSYGEPLPSSFAQSILLHRGYGGQNGATRWRNFLPSGREKTPHMCFYETNPPFCNPIFYTTCYAHVSCGENGREISVGSFWKTNPPGGGNEVGFIEKWVRLSRKYGVRRLVGLGSGRRSHFQKVWRGDAAR
jgi:hypothetical protein